MLRTKRAFQMKRKAIFIVFEGLSLGEKKEKIAGTRFFNMYLTILAVFESRGFSKNLYSLF